MADSCAAVVAGEDYGNWGGEGGEKGGEGCEEGISCAALVVGSGKGGGAAVARDLGVSGKKGERGGD